MDELIKSSQKSFIKVWCICYKAVILHPLSREERGGNEMLIEDLALKLFFEKKYFSKKTSKKFW